MSLVVARQIAIADVDPPSERPPPPIVASDRVGARPPEPPVSSTLEAPSETRVKVNFGKTPSDESKALPSLLNDIDPPEALVSERFTFTVQDSVWLSV